jgi:hypothetical protein
VGAGTTRRTREPEANASAFGCCRHRPLDRPGSAGLLRAINGGRLVELYRDWAVVELAENGSERIFDRRRASIRPTTGDLGLGSPGFRR